MSTMANSLPPVIEYLYQTATNLPPCMGSQDCTRNTNRTTAVGNTLQASG